MRKQWMAVAAMVAAILPAAYGQARKGSAPWRNNVNLPGGDFLSIDMNTSDPSGCKAACEREGRCKAWTFVKPDESGRAYCWLKDSVPEAIREDCCVSALKGEGVTSGGSGSGSGWGAGSTSTPRRWRDNLNLPGGDYKSIDMRTSDPGRCQAACEREGRCRAWTFVKPDENGNASCWLKDSVPEASREDCCASGYKDAAAGSAGGTGGTANTGPRWRNNTNLPGGDYLSIDMNTSDPAGCRNACERDGRCKAWTFVKPDESGRAYCWLKDSVPEAIREDCCVSALKGEGAPGGRRR